MKVMHSAAALVKTWGEQGRTVRAALDIRAALVPRATTEPARGHRTPCMPWGSFMSVSLKVKATLLSVLPDLILTGIMDSSTQRQNQPLHLFTLCLPHIMPIEMSFQDLHSGPQKKPVPEVWWKQAPKYLLAGHILWISGLVGGKELCWCPEGLQWPKPHSLAGGLKGSCNWERWISCQKPRKVFSGRVDMVLTSEHEM